MPNLMFNPASLQSASNVLFRREKKDEIAPTISASWRRRMLDDPRQDSIAALQEGAMNHIPNSGWAGAAAQIANAWVGKGEEKKLESDYLGQQQSQGEAYRAILEGDDVDPTIRKMVQSGVPELQETAIGAYLKQKLEAKEKDEYTYQDVNGEIVGLNKRNPNDRVPVGPATKKDERTSDQKDYEFARQQAMAANPNAQFPGFTDWAQGMKRSGASRTTNIATNAPGQKDNKWGEAPTGYTFLRDPGTGDVLTDPDPRGGVRPRIAPMGGGKDDAERGAIEEKANKAKRNQFNSANIVLRTIDDAKKKLNKRTTGLGGAVLSNVPGTEAYDLSKDLETIKATAAFGELSKMREASPTGGALGAVERSEMLLLQSTIAVVEQAQSEEELREALNHHAEVYEAVVNGGPDEAMRAFNKSAAKSGAKTDSTIRYDAQGRRVK